MTEVNQQRGHTIAGAEKRVLSARERTCRKVHKLCKKYFVEENSKTQKDLDKATSYLQKFQINKMAKDLGVQPPDYSNPNKWTKVKDIDSFDKYFCHEPDGMDRKWKVLLVPPSFNADRSTLYVSCWFPSFEEIVKVDLLEADKYCDAYEMICLLSFV